MRHSSWLILTERYGGDHHAPSREELSKAVRELFVENLPGMTEADYAEHPDSWLRYGFDDGPMYVITIDRLRNARFEELADQDFEAELVPARTARLESQDDALRLWALLADGDLEAIRR